MKASYHLDFSKFSLQKFKRSLQGRTMIPSRTILKDDIEKNFKIIGRAGITTMKELVDALKKKPDIDAFAGKTGLTVEYLTILNREARSFHANPVPLEKFQGIDTQVLAMLAARGIKNTKQYFNTVNCGKGPRHLADETGIAPGVLEELAGLSDLARLYGVGPVFARMIYDVGVDSVRSFVKNTPEEFVAIYEKKTGKKADFSESDISFSIELAKELLV